MACLNGSRLPIPSPNSFQDAAIHRLNKRVSKYVEIFLNHRGVTLLLVIALLFVGFPFSSSVLFETVFSIVIIDVQGINVVHEDVANAPAPMVSTFPIGSTTESGLRAIFG